MRSEQAMLELILDAARNDERIRVVVLNGSRANPNAPRDVFQDFDIRYFVTDPTPFIHNLEWIRQFGELMILQLPDEMLDPAPEISECYSYLMQFADGNRIDLGIFPMAALPTQSDSLTVLLLDKDGAVTERKSTGESDYLPRPPTQKAFEDCCNEFWWVSLYVAKGLWREEITYARVMMDEVVRHELMKMLAWYVGWQTEYRCNLGYHGKWLQKYMAPELWQMLMNTYAGSDLQHNWDALLAMGELFRTIAVPLADHYGFIYPAEDDRQASAHILYVRKLPKDARELY